MCFVCRLTQSSCKTCPCPQILCNDEILPEPWPPRYARQREPVVGIISTWELRKMYELWFDWHGPSFVTRSIGPLTLLSSLMTQVKECTIVVCGTPDTGHPSGCCILRMTIAGTTLNWPPMDFFFQVGVYKYLSLRDTYCVGQPPTCMLDNYTCNIITTPAM